MYEKSAGRRVSALGFDRFRDYRRREKGRRGVILWSYRQFDQSWVRGVLAMMIMSQPA